MAWKQVLFLSVSPQIIQLAMDMPLCSLQYFRADIQTVSSFPYTFAVVFLVLERVTAHSGGVYREFNLLEQCEYAFRE